MNSWLHNKLWFIKQLGITTYAIKWILVICFIMPFIAHAERYKKILIIHSDSDWDNYQISNEAFNDSTSYPIEEIIIPKVFNINSLKKKLTDEQYPILYCVGGSAYSHSIEYASKKNIVFTSVFNWDRFPKTSKTYGVLSEFHPEMELTLIKYIFPDLKRIGVIYSREFNEDRFIKLQKTAMQVDINVIGHSLKKRKELSTKMKSLLPKVQVFWLISDPIIMNSEAHLIEIIKTCDKAKVPIFSYNAMYANLGVTFTISIDIPTVGRQAAAIVNNIMAGNDVEEKIQFPAGSYISLHTQKAKKYGLKVDPEAIKYVNKIIE